MPGWATDEPKGSGRRFAVRARQAEVPVAENSAEILPKPLQVLDLPVDVAELSFGEDADLPAGRMSAVPGAEQSRQLVERETDGERALDQQNAIERVGRVGAVTVGEAPRFSENSLALVVAERVGADARSSGDLPRSKPRRRPCFRHGWQSRPRNRSGSQGGVSGLHESLGWRIRRCRPCHLRESEVASGDLTP
jgi:hypothetical protein